MPYQTMQQSLSQVAQICNQLSQNEQTTVAKLQQLQQAEQTASQQLQQCVQLCNQALQQVQQITSSQLTSSQFTSPIQFGGYATTGTTQGGYGNWTTRQ